MVSIDPMRLNHMNHIRGGSHRHTSEFNKHTITHIHSSKPYIIKRNDGQKHCLQSVITDLITACWSHQAFLHFFHWVLFSGNDRVHM